MNILFLNHSKTNCGVYQYGKRTFDIINDWSYGLKNHTDQHHDSCMERDAPGHHITQLDIKRDHTINYIYRELDSYDEYIRILQENPTIIMIIYNYHVLTMPWLNHTTIQKNVKNISIAHESSDDIFDIKLSIDPNGVNGLPRPIFENIENTIQSWVPSTNTIRDFIEHKGEHIPIFGSFGFGFDCKGFPKIVELINSTYDEAIIKFVIPLAHFRGDTDPSLETTLIAQKCIDKITKPNITLLITHEFFTNEDLLCFLNSNTMNIFLYDTMQGRGISSVIDYAISVKTPLGISDSYMFRHIYSDAICLYKTSIQDCMLYSTEYCNTYRNTYSNQNLITTMKNIIVTHFPICSQSYQDYFVLSVLKHKQNGYFVEIGTNHPSENNNTCILHKHYNYKGLMVEYVRDFEHLYREQRPSCNYIIGDARNIPYKQFLDENQYPKNIDYLQIDLDVDNKSTLDTLELFDNTVFDTYKFATVTFEHDIYRGDYFNTRQKSREIFLRRGYILLFANVSVFWQGADCPYEDWYVHPELVDMEYIKEIISGNYVNYTSEQIKQILDQLYSK
jgi:hypothetical protein